MEPIRHRIGIGLASALGFAFLVFTHATFSSLSKDLDDADELLGRCTVELDGARHDLRLAQRERDFAIARASAAAKLVSKTSGESTDRAFRLLRAHDTIAALRDETEKLKQSIAALKAVAIETGSVETRVEPVRKRVKRKRKPAPKPKPVHPWVWW